MPGKNRRWSRWIKAGVAMGLAGAGLATIHSLYRPTKHESVPFIRPRVPSREKSVEGPVIKENIKKSPEIKPQSAPPIVSKPKENYFSLKNKKNREYTALLYGNMSRGVDKSRIPEDWNRFSSVWLFPHSGGKWNQLVQPLDFLELKLIDRSGNIDMSSPSTYFVYQPRTKTTYEDGKPLPLHEMGHFVDLHGRPDQLRVVHIYRPLWKN